MTKQKIAIYPGSFNPFTIGHLNILEKAEAIFGKENVIIVVGVNPDKVSVAYTTSGTFIRSSDPRIKTIELNLPSKKVEGFCGFLTDYIWEKEAEGFDVTVVKGLRNGDDLDYEVNQLRFMEEMKLDVKVLYLVCDKQYEHVSSSAYRALEKVREGAGHKYLAKESEPNYIVIVDFKSFDSYALMVDAPKNYEYLHKRLKVFKGTKSECNNWIKENPYEEFKESDYDFNKVISYDREQWTLLSINEAECQLAFEKDTTSGGVFVKRYNAPWIWKELKKK